MAIIPIRDERKLRNAILEDATRRLGAWDEPEYGNGWFGRQMHVGHCRGCGQEVPHHTLYNGVCWQCMEGMK